MVEERIWNRIKPKRVVDKAYLEFVKKHSCCRCLKGPAYPHHLKSVGAGGSDYGVVPMCLDHHAEIHREGQKAFEDNHAINLWKAAAGLLAEWIENLKEQMLAEGVSYPVLLEIGRIKTLTEGE